ncbi:MAG: metallophosphoesterase, partial [Polaromonas sp.]
MNVLLLMGVSALLHVYVGARLVPELEAFSVGQIFLLGILAVSALMTPLGLMARRVARPALADALSWAGLLFMGL